MEVAHYMRPEYDGIKYHSVYDLSVGDSLSNAALILESFDENRKYTDINEVIELYNIQELMNSGARLKTWNDTMLNHYKELCRPLIKVIGKFFGVINDNNFIDMCRAVSIGYVEDFWNLIVKFKVYEKVSKEVFSHYLQEPETTLGTLLQKDELVKYYGVELAECLRNSEQTPRLIVSKFLQKHDDRYSYNFPKELSPSEYEEILQKYVNSGSANPNMLKLLASCQSSKECPISDKLRLSAKRAFDTCLENNRFARIQIAFGVGVGFSDSAELVDAKRTADNVYQITYDIKWFLENLDYPTILNNFRYLFEQFDFCWRSNLVSVKSQLGIFEKALLTRGIKDYITGNHFNFMENLSTMQIKGYYDLLKDNGIHLENVFKWFFEEYLSQEFGAYGFRFNPPSEGTTLVEKCRTIASEMDGVFKQFRMYVQDGEIDQELFEMSSEHIVFSGLSGFIENKYAYGNSKDIQNEQFLLFSDQSYIFYTERTQSKYNSFYELLSHEEMNISEFREYQRTSIEWLIERNIVIKQENGYLKLNKIISFILKDLYEHDVICIQYYKEWESIIEEWHRRGDLRFSGSLFSEPEQDYLNYELNKSTFSNGLDLRNKYSHSTYPSNEKTQLADYMSLLKIMVLVVTKINDEFCLRGD